MVNGRQSVNEEVIFNDKVMFQIGNSLITQSDGQNFAQIDSNNKDVYLVEAAGFNDTNKKMRIANDIILKNVLKNSATFKILLIIDVQ